MNVEDGVDCSKLAKFVFEITVGNGKTLNKNIIEMCDNVLKNPSLFKWNRINNFGMHFCSVYISVVLVDIYIWFKIVLVSIITS